MNQRPIKFRAYHKPTKRVFEVYGFNDHYVFENSLDGPHTSETLPADRADCVLQQFTGLVDKAGNEIYEGDVVSVFTNWHGKPSGTEFKAFISYNGYVGAWQIAYRNINNVFVTDDIGLTYFLQVIGNVHQHPI